MTRNERREPGIYLPAVAQRASGLWVLSTAAEMDQPQPSQVPSGLRTTTRFVRPVEAAPTGLDLFGVGPDEEALGWDISTSDEVRGMVASLPFEPTMLLVSWMETAYTLVRSNRDGQMQLARDLFGCDAPVTQALERFVAEDPSHFPFDERHFATLRALLVMHAADVKLGEGEPDTHVLVRALYATSALVEPASSAPGLPTGQFRDWVAFLVRGGAYYTPSAPLHTIALSYALWIDLACRAEVADHPDFCDVNEWLTGEYGFTAREMLAIGFGIVAGTGILNEKQAFAERAVLQAHFAQETALADRASAILDLISVDRQWYAQHLPHGEHLVWERTPFEQRPMLRLANGALLLTSPQAIWSWIGDGFYFRLLDIARSRSEPTRLTRFYGELVERYILELVASAHSGSELPGSGRVFGEEVSGTGKRPIKTPDVAVDLGEDLVLMEVVSGRLTYGTRVEGDTQALERDLGKLLDKKLRQLSERSDEFLAGTISIANLRREHVKRIWPVLVISEGLVVAEPLWQYIADTHPDAFADDRVKPLTILDAHELELLMALVEEGQSLAELLERKSSGGWRVLPVRRWVHDEFPEGEAPRQLQLVKSHWDAAWSLVLDVMFPDRDRG